MKSNSKRSGGEHTKRPTSPHPSQQGHRAAIGTLIRVPAGVTRRESKGHTDRWTCNMAGSVTRGPLLLQFLRLLQSWFQSQVLSASQNTLLLQSSKLRLFPHLHPNRKYCNRPVVKAYLLTGKMCTRILLSAKSLFLSSRQQVLIGHPLATYTLGSKVMATAPVEFTLYLQNVR